MASATVAQVETSGCPPKSGDFGYGQSATAGLERALRAVEELVAADVPQATFFRRLLAQTVEPLQARAGIVWVLNPDGLLDGACESGLDSLAGERGWLGSPQHLQWLDEALGSSEPVVHETDERFASGGIVVLARFEVQERPAGVIEFFLGEESGGIVDDSRRSFVAEVAVHAARFLAWRQEADSAAKQIEFWAGLNELTADLHRSLRSVEVAATAVNDGRPLLGVDRVSLAVRRGAGCRIVAISGQDRVNRRANLVRTLSALAGEVLRTGQTLTYTGRLDEFPAEIERRLTDYLAHSGSRMVRLIPLFPPGAAVGAAPVGEGAPARVTGVLIVENIGRSWLTPLDLERSERLAEHLAGAVANAQSHEGLFLLPVWRTLGGMWRWLRGRRLALFAVVVVLLGGILGGLCLVPADYRVEASGRLMPREKRAVFAPWDGEVVELFVTSEQRVDRDQPLLRLRNEELHTELLAAGNQLEEKRKALTALEAELDEINRRSTAPHDAVRIRGRIAQTRTEIAGAEERVHSLERQIDLLTVRAPIAGTVTAFQVQELLLNRPVERGELLLEVMDESGPWQLELEVPEFRMGHVLGAREAAGAADLPVEFVLATRPEERLSGVLREVSTRTGLSDDGGTIVAARAAIDIERLPFRTIGAEVQAKITCGERSVGYVLFGDVVEFFQRRFW